MNLKQVDLTLRPDGNVAHIETDPPLTSLDITNDVRLTNAPCTAAGRNAVQLQVPDPRTANAVRIAGTYPWRCGPVTWPRTLMTHDQYALGLFTALWREMGGEFGGRLKVAPVPPNAPTLLLWRGNTLAEAIRPMNKSSSNVMARQLLLTLGAERFGAPATPEKGAQAVADYVTRLGLDPIAVHVVNGSGLSREERVTARLLGALLVRGARMPFAPEFISSLSLAGYDGTTRRRFSGVAEAGEMHLKTGHLNDVSALAGYVRARSGRVFVVVGMINTPRVSAGVAEPVLNTMVQWVYTH
jgi:D-alanyl-D-alanine carboxypeptidase/D-alanyl-D-alanine-endopeptidase (penicillin-binding protein 4)